MNFKEVTKALEDVTNTKVNLAVNGDLITATFSVAIKVETLYMNNPEKMVNDLSEEFLKELVKKLRGA